MSLLKTWKRQILRTISRKNGTLDRTIKKVATGIAGLGFLATAQCVLGQSTIVTQDANSTFILNEPGASGQNYHITTGRVSGVNAFTSFSSFNLATNDTANFYLPNGTENLLNFVNSRIDINGTVNAIKNFKIGGNLYFLSSHGIVVGNNGVINCGAFYAMTPTPEFMESFVTEGFLNIAGKEDEISRITSRAVANHNNTLFSEGVPINSDGSIVVSGRINVIDNVGLYSGNVNLESSGRIDTGITDFSSLVNLANVKELSVNGEPASSVGIPVEVSGLAMTTNEDGNVELVAVADNLDKTSLSSIQTNGFSSYVKAAAEAKVTVKGTVNARRDASFEAVAVNGKLAGIADTVEYGQNRAVKTFYESNSISSVKATVELAGTARINASNNINLKAFAMNVYKSSTSPLALGLTLAGMTSPININAELAVSDSKAEIKVAQGAQAKAQKNINIDANSEADVIVGASTVLSKIKQTSGGVSAGAVFAEVNSESNVEISGVLNAGTAGDTTAGDININAVSNNALDATAASKTASDKAAIATGVVIGKVSNKAKIKINSTAAVDAKRAVTGKSSTVSDVSTVAIVETGDDTYAGMAVNYTVLTQKQKSIQI